jgi:hypothetical protein
MARPSGKQRKTKGFVSGMRVIATTTDPVRLSFLRALLADAGIASIVLDAHISAIEGGIGAFPRRLAVLAEDEARALELLRDAEA